MTCRVLNVKCISMFCVSVIEVYFLGVFDGLSQCLRSYISKWITSPKLRTGGGGGGSKTLKILCTYFMDDPFTYMYI